MRDFAECKPFLDHIAAEHRQMHHALQDINVWLRNPKGPEDTIQIVERLTDLRANLARHFADEENEGCLEEAICRCPSLSPQSTQLQREHPELLFEVDDLLRLLHANPQSTLDEIAQAFTRLVRDLEAHECSENRILQQAFGTYQSSESE